MKRLALALLAPLLLASTNPATETEHVVEEGETLGGIANRAGVPAAVIAALRVRALPQAGGQPNAHRGLEVELVPATAAPGEPPIDLSLERWSLRSCHDVVVESSGLSLRVPEPAERSA